MQTGTEAHLASCTMGIAPSSPASRGRGVTLTPTPMPTPFQRRGWAWVGLYLYHPSEPTWQMRHSFYHCPIWDNKTGVYSPTHLHPKTETSSCSEMQATPVIATTYENPWKGANFKNIHPFALSQTFQQPTQVSAKYVSWFSSFFGEERTWKLLTHLYRASHWYYCGHGLTFTFPYVSICCTYLTLRRRIKSHLLFAGIIRSSPFSLR